jgi:N-acyl amino acid synthase of PEP-CTERM/exosortase system
MAIMVPDRLAKAAQADASLQDGFNARFQILWANTEALKDEVYRLRHRVYCEDLKWETARASGRETDEYDPHSLHFLLRYRASGQNVGCVRIVLVPPGDVTFRLPFERVFEGRLDAVARALDGLPRDKVAEVSRLAVLSDFRRRRGEAAKAAPDTTGNLAMGEKPRFPFILVGLYVAVVAMAKLRGIQTVFVLTEPRLAKHFKSIGVTEVRQIGGPVEHRGQRIPSLMPVDGIVEGFCMNPLIRPIYESTYDGFAAAVNRAA